MLKRISIANFKAFGEPQTGRLARITLIVGPNSSGKSSLIQGLRVLHQSLDSHPPRLVAQGGEVDMRSRHSITYRHDLNRGITLSVAFDPPRGESTLREHFESLLHAEPAGCIGLTLDFFGNAAVEHLDEDCDGIDKVQWLAAYAGGLDRMHLTAGDLHVCLVRDEMTSEATPLFRWADTDPPSTLQALRAIFSRGHSPAEHDALGALADPKLEWPDRVPVMLESITSFRLPQSLSLTHNDETSWWTAAVPAIDALLKRLGRQITRTFDCLVHIGPARSAPARQMPFSPAGAAHVAYADSINEWLQRLEIGYAFEPSVIGHALADSSVVLALRDLRTDLAVSLADVGYGVSQVLPIIMQPYSRSEPQILYVEQPELHLHPKLQGNVADFMIATSTPNTEPERLRPRGVRQWVVETHSEAIVSRVQRRVREGVLRPEEVSVLYVEPGPEGSTIRELRLDLHGQFIDEWPGGFFEETYWDLFGGVQ